MSEQLDKEALEATNRIMDAYERCPRLTSDCVRTIITAAYAPRIEAYERLRKAVYRHNRGDTLATWAIVCEAMIALDHLDALEKQAK